MFDARIGAPTRGDLDSCSTAISWAMIKPKRLRRGDRVAIVSLSWGGPAAYPARYAMGRQVLVERFGLQPVEMPHTLREPDWLQRHPEARAADLMQAFADDAIRAVISSIGGEDSIRLIRHVDLGVLRAKPKIFLGYSDSTVTHWLLRQAGVISFYGPAVMAGFAESGGPFGYSMQAVQRLLFDAKAPTELRPSGDGWTSARQDWGAAHQGPRPLQPAEPWRWLQGEGVAQGRLIGGCLEVVEFLRGTALWPSPQDWDGAILFLEISEEAPPPSTVARALRSYAAMGVLQRLAGLLFGRPGGGLRASQFAAYEEAIGQVLREEEGLTQLPVISRMDFGHSDPMCVLPIGGMLRIDCARQRLSLVEACVQD